MLLKVLHSIIIDDEVIKQSDLKSASAFVQDKISKSFSTIYEQYVRLSERINIIKSEVKVKEEISTEASMTAKRSSSKKKSIRVGHKSSENVFISEEKEIGETDDVAGLVK